MLSRDAIRHEALQSGLKLKPQANGREDLNEYIFVFVERIINRLNEEKVKDLLLYPATFTPEEDGDGFMVTFRDIPQAITAGSTLSEAIEYAHDALLVCQDFYKEEGLPYPSPSVIQAGDIMIALTK